MVSVTVVPPWVLMTVVVYGFVDEDTEVEVQVLADVGLLVGREVELVDELVREVELVVRVGGRLWNGTPGGGRVWDTRESPPSPSPRPTDAEMPRTSILGWRFWRAVALRA